MCGISLNAYKFKIYTMETQQEPDMGYTASNGSWIVLTEN